MGGFGSCPRRRFKQLQNKQLGNASCFRVKVNETTDPKRPPLLSQHPDKNAYLAYLTLTHAQGPEEYQQVMCYLEGARKFGRYTGEEPRILGALFLSAQETPDHTGYAEACRLFAAWLVQDNLKRNPAPQPAPKSSTVWPKFSSSTEDWIRFWEGQYIKTSKKGEVATKGLMTSLQKISKRYFERAGHLPVGMRMEDLISNRELAEWNLGALATAYEREPPITPLRLGALVPHPPRTHWEQKYPFPWLQHSYRPEQDEDKLVAYELLTRPGGSFQSQFWQLLDAGMNGDETQRRMVADIVRNMAHDKVPELTLGRTILDAALHYHSSAKAKALVDRAFQLTTMPGADGDDSELWQLARTWWDHSHRPMEAQEKISFPDIPPVDVLPPSKAVDLPNNPERPARIPFTLPQEGFGRLDRLFRRAFLSTEPSAAAVAIEPFQLNTEDPWLRTCIAELNEDYALGAKRNREMPVYALTGKVPIDKLITTHRGAISSELEHYRSEVLMKEEAELLRLANRPSVDPLKALQQKTALEAGRADLLSVNDCVGLFLLGDVEAYRRATNLTDEADIAGLHQLIGNYMVTHNRVERYKAVLDELNRLASLHERPHTPEQEQACIQSLAEALRLGSLPVVQDEQAPRLGEDSQVSAAMMVFEYSLNLVLREHQIEGVRDMLKVDHSDPRRLRSKLLQRIQGGGKSLVFGHIMAIMNADGYHLSVHVPPTAQYHTALYNMAQRSKQIFGQREHTVVFNDDPLKFTVEYLTSIKEMFKEAIVNRDYVTMTKETLQAMRCKYLKTRFLIKLTPEGPQKEALRASNRVLKDILRLLRERGVLTFDEVHLAFAPTKELNMPYGPATHPDYLKSQLISHIIRLACAAHDENGHPLLDVEHSSEQTPEQREKMKQSIIDRLLQDPAWNHPGIREFLYGTLEDLPASFEGEDQRTLATLITLAKQMLAGKWLEERLNTSVNEDHGLAMSGQTRISIPFVANMSPAAGSEFSDPIVMTCNTFLAYLVGGLDDKQTLDFISSCRNKAMLEKIAKANTEPDLSIQETSVALQFARAFDIPLFHVDIEKPSDIATIKTRLLNGREDTMELMLNYVIETQISAVELFEHQVCSTGQNTAGIGQSLNGYSGSMENQNMAPVGVEIKPERGTNGQTIDRLISQNTEVRIVEGNAKSLFTDLIDNHPRRDDVRAIIDVGAHFRGMDNTAAARLICGKLKDYQSQASGVLFFHPISGELCFMHRDSPDDFTILSGSSKETIAEETGLRPDQLFTYYDQDHITGTDIVQMPDAVAILTAKEDTEIHEVLQGSRRLRDLDRGQRIVVALSRGALPMINQAIGKILASPIKQFLLFTCLCEAMKQKPENLLFALQKIEHQVQQFVLDRLYQLPEEEEEALFAEVGYLFDKDISIDLYREYARRRQQVATGIYLTSVMDGLITPLVDKFPREQLEVLREGLMRDVINEPTLNSIQEEIAVSRDFKPSEPLPVVNLNREANRVQFKEQKQESEISQEQVDQQENLAEYLRQVEQSRDRKQTKYEEVEISPQAFTAENFGVGTREQQFGPATEEQIWNLDAAFQSELENAPLDQGFDPRIAVTKNASIVYTDRTDLIGPFRKKPYSVLLIRDTNASSETEWRSVVCSLKDALQFEKWLDEKSLKLPKGRQMWLLRTNGKPFSSRETYDPALLSDPDVSTMLLQILLFTGDYQTLSRKPWADPFQKWLKSHPESSRNQWADLFEKEILRGIPPDYPLSRMGRLLRPERFEGF